MYRLFTAIDLPSNISKQISNISYGLPGAKWIDEDQLHLTLRFIGEVDGAVFLDIKEVLLSISMQPFKLQLKGLGYFPPRKSPRVLWVGIVKNPFLDKIRNRIESKLIKTGLAPEGRKFAPHITLARLKNTPANRLGSFLAGNGLFETHPFEVKNFLLYSSKLTPKGAIHTIEASYPLD